MSEEGTSKRDPQVDQCSSHIKSYSKDDFHNRHHLGSGGFSEVYSYYNKDLKLVAIKMFSITGDNKTNKGTRDMVEREVHILSCFRHENIVEVLGITEWPNAVGIVMEYVDGGNLHTLLSNRSQLELSWETRLKIAQGIISALSYIHNFDEKKKYCHGDIKPDNVLLTLTLVVKLADFGSAALQRATGASKSASKFAPAKQYTMFYVAPEFFKDNALQKYPAMDMYSFGSVLYELITTKPPYDGFPLPGLLRELITAGNKPDIKLVDQTEEQLQTDLDRIIFNLLKKLMHRCWNDDPASRPNSKTVKEEVDGDLKKLQQDTSYPDHKTELTADEAAAHAAHQDRDVGADSVSSQSGDQSSKQEISETTSSKHETPADKFSKRLRQYPKDEFNVREDSLIGSGGYGDVRKYDHKDQAVAIKEFTVKGDDETIAKIWKMVLREANILCRFDHENVVKILGVTQWDKGVGIVMEFVDGGNLHSLLEKSELSWKTRLEIAKGITSGLEYIHNYGEKKAFCHGDLKPENILLTQSLQVKLGDFGSAAFYRATGASSSTIIAVPTTQFTLVYTAPEFLQDTTLERNPTMDMYSFGMVLYELISGKAPYSDCSVPVQVPALIVSGIKPTQKPIDEVKSQLKSDDDRLACNQLSNVMERCWNNDPASRPSSKTVKPILSGEWINASELFTEAHLPKQELSRTTTSKPESPADKFSKRVRQYSKDEFKVHNKEDSFIGSGGYGDVRKYHHKDQVVAIKEFAVKGDEKMINKIWKISSQPKYELLRCEMPHSKMFFSDYFVNILKSRNQFTRFPVSSTKRTATTSVPRVLHEANILCRFDHENVVKILGVTQWEKGVGIVMEFVDGGNLHSLLEKSGLSWKTRLEIAKGITSGLEYIHNYGEKKSFSHGDLKPENILLTQSLQVKLADFGSAAFYRATGASATTIENVSTKQFTLLYVAPEFLQDTTLERNPTMDMYSFGMVLYELVSGKAPYSDCSMPMQVPVLILGGIKPTQKLIDKAKSQLKSDNDRSTFNQLSNVMERCWNYDSASRPSSKTVKEELDGGWMNQQQSSSSPVHKPRKDAFASERRSAPASSMKKSSKKATKTFAPKTSPGQVYFDSDRPSTSKAGIPMQTSRGNASWKQMADTNIVSLKQTAEKTTSEKSWETSGRSTFLGSNMSVQNHLASYANSLLNENFEQAENYKTKLQSLLVNDINETAQGMKLFGGKLQDEGKYLHSIAIFDTASALFARMENPEEGLEGIQFCVQAMRQASKALIDDNPNMKKIVIFHVLPLMRSWLDVVKSTSQVSAKWQCYALSWVFSNIEVCEMLTDQSKKRMQTIKEAVATMSRVYGDDVYRQQGRLYGNLLNHLASEHVNISRSEEAAQLYREAAHAQKEAMDYFGDEEERQRDVFASEHNVKGCLQAAWQKQLQQK